MGSLINQQQLTGLLSAHPLFRCEDDVEATSSKVGEVFRPHRLDVVGARQRLNAEMNHTQSGGLSISRLRYRADVEITSDPMGSFFLVMIPMKGSADVSSGGKSVRSTTQLASVVGSTSALAMRWSADCNQLILKLNRAHLESTCASLLGHDLTKPIDFQLGMDLTSPATAGLQRIISFVGSCEELSLSAEQYPLIAAQTEKLLMTALLNVQPHNYRDELLRPGEIPAPRYVKRAEEFIASRAAEPITIEDIAAAAGVSARSLQTGFKKFRDTSPMMFLRDVRLQRVREELVTAKLENQSASVTGVALAWGFTHLGHFTRAYAEKFKELPSDTLRR